ncbi:MAG: hypothetical protein DHS20C02_03650 [Micavibrio sp.]|nr:MAG: hypothetical protein DHS20C02_03650 [Micavibrio sp.]
MSKHIIRSVLFNICFLIATAISCIIYIPTLLLPRKLYLGTVTAYLLTVQFFERHVMGITYEVRGLEHLPKDGPYLIASKHQSLFETFKLRLIFDDPAIILKKELLRIPLWGLYLGKSDVIAIDRSTPERALKSIEEGALRMKAQGRPIIIFPQGTRVHPDETPADKPYKAGIARVQDATELPVIPMALNSGYFWPKRGWLKKPGTVIFQLLKPIEPGKMDRKKLMNTLEQRIEKESSKLAAEAKEKKPTTTKKRISTPIKVLLLISIFACYSAYWFSMAERASNIYVGFMQDLMPERTFSAPVVSGFPGKIHMHIASEYLQSPEGTLQVENLKARSWPFPFLPAHLNADKVEIRSFKWREPLIFQDFAAKITVIGNILNIKESNVRRETFEGSATGSIDFSQQPYPKFDLSVAMKNHEDFLEHLGDLKIIKRESALLMGFALSAFKEDGVVTVPITQKKQTLYAGPLPVASLPGPRQPYQAPRRNRPAPSQ